MQTNPAVEQNKNVKWSETIKPISVREQIEKCCFFSVQCGEGNRAAIMYM